MVNLTINDSKTEKLTQVGDVGYIFHKEFNGLWCRGVVLAIRKGAGKSMVYIEC